MTHDELSKFTHDELSHLRHFELSLEKLTLIAETEKGNCQLPDEIQQKLISLCKTLDNTNEFTKPHSFNFKTLSDVVKVLSNICKITDFVIEHFDSLKEIIEIIEAFIENLS